MRGNSLTTCEWPWLHTKEARNLGNMESQTTSSLKMEKQWK